MIDISVWGATPYKRRLAKEVALFCMATMMPRMRNIEICIELLDDLDVDGYCLSVNKREFEIQIDKNLRGDDFITAITHEMTHVKQYARGETKDLKTGVKVWKGEEYLSIFSTVDEYIALPWEAEAYEMQEILLGQYKANK